MARCWRWALWRTCSPSGTCPSASASPWPSNGAGTAGPPGTDSDAAEPDALLTRLTDALRARQSVFAATGGLHAAGFFELDGTLAVAREDVGRHNATDKAVGALLRARRPTPPILLVSGRLGFEIAQKAALAGAKVVAAVSAPTSLAVDLAEEAGLTLVGFLRGERFNVYAHAERIRR